MNIRTDTRRPRGSATVLVWDPIVRVTHWTVVVGCTVNLLLENGGKVHRTVGYVVAAAVAVRLVWGFVGKGHARFKAFVPRPAMLWNYLKLLYRNREPRYMGHSPAGSIMILVLLFLLAGICITGWMIDLDSFSGIKILKTLHEALAMTLLPVVGIHVLAGFVGSIAHQDNLFKSMITGRKRKPDPGDINDAIDIQ